MDSAKRSAGAGCLPDDVLVEILSLLPAKFLYRSKCVSKAWHDLITDRLRCGKKLPLTLEGFFYGYGSNDDGWGSNKDDEVCLNSPDEVDGCFINLLGKPSPLFDASLSFLRNQQPSSEVDFEYLANYNYLTLLDSCNGLLLFAKNTRDTRLVFPSIPQGYIMCYPATEHWVHVPSSGFPMTGWGGSSDDDGETDDELWDMSYETHLILDPVVSSHFQLIELCVGCEGTAVSTFSSETKQWGDRLSEWEGLKKGGDRDFLLDTIDSGRGSTFFNNMLHLIVSPSSTGPELIVAVDRKGKICRVSRWLENRGFPVFVGQSKGLLHCISVSGHADGNSRNMTELSIWVLEDYDAEVWNLKHTVSFLDLFGRRACQFYSDYNVATIHPDHNLVFFVEDYKLISYDMDRKEVGVLCNVGRDYMRIIPYFPYFSELPALSKKNFELLPFKVRSSNDGVLYY